MLKENILKIKGPILILGASGFVGANLLRMILKYREDCIGTFHNKSWRLKDIPTKNLLKLDATSPDEIKVLLNVTQPATVFNLIAFGAYSSQKDSDLIYNTNFLATTNILNALKNSSLAAYVHAGTSSEYGLNCNEPTESGPLEPNSDYAVSKVACSYLIKYYGEVLNQPVANLRLYSIYGAYEEPSRLIPNLILQGFKKTYPPFVDAKISRDFIYIDDVINAFALAAIKINAIKGKSINIASGKQTTIEDLAFISKSIFQIEEPPVFSNMKNKNWDLQKWVGNPSMAENILGWRCETDIVKGLKNTISWFENTPNTLEFYENFNEDTQIKKDKISAIIACYKDNLAIPIMYERLKKVFEKLNVDYEIIFVNDNSPDNSEEVICELTQKDSRVIGISHSRNFGSQAGFVSGMKLSSGDAVVLLDGDLQDPPELIEEFYQKWKQGNDVVYGVRVKREMSRFWEFFYKSFYQIFSFLSDVNIPKNAGDFSLMDKIVIKKILSLPEKDIFLRGLRAWVGFKQTGVEYIRPERVFGKSTNNFLKNVWWAKKGIFSFSNKPLEYISYLSLGVFFVAFLFIITQGIVRIFKPEIVPPGLTTVIILILFLGGMQLFCISIIGEYIAKIIQEVKGRPIFIRKTIIMNGKKTGAADA